MPGREREVTLRFLAAPTDVGYSGSVELYTPNVMPHFGAKWGELRFLAFYDLGHVDDNDVAPSSAGTTVMEPLSVLVPETVRPPMVVAPAREDSAPDSSRPFPPS